MSSEWISLFSTILVVSGPILLLLVRNNLATRQLRRDLRIPKRVHPNDRRRPKSVEDSISLAEGIVELRRDIYELGQLFGSHLVFHEREPAQHPVKLSDLTALDDLKKRREG